MKLDKIAVATGMAILAIFWAQMALGGNRTDAIEYVSPQRIVDLRTQFESAEPLSSDRLSDLQGKVWICDLYGVRTRMQVERGLKLYQFKSGKEHWWNDGSQVVREYKHKSGHLVGKTSNLRDQLRYSDGKIWSQLSLERNNTSTVLAYAECLEESDKIKV